MAQYNEAFRAMARAGGGTGGWGAGEVRYREARDGTLLCLERAVEPGTGRDGFMATALTNDAARGAHMERLYAAVRDRERLPPPYEAAEVAAFEARALGGVQLPGMLRHYLLRISRALACTPERAVFPLDAPPAVRPALRPRDLRRSALCAADYAPLEGGAAFAAPRDATLTVRLSSRIDLIVAGPGIGLLMTRRGGGEGDDDEGIDVALDPLWALLMAPAPGGRTAAAEASW